VDENTETVRLTPAQWDAIAWLFEEPEPEEKTA
jgi:hypothetical protein